MPTIAEDFSELMHGWDTIMKAAREQSPDATEEEIYEIAKGAMNHALGIKTTN